MSNVHARWQTNETFCATTKETYDQPNSFGGAKFGAERRNHSDHCQNSYPIVLQIGQTVMKFIELFHSGLAKSQHKLSLCRPVAKTTFCQFLPAGKNCINFLRLIIRK